MTDVLLSSTDFLDRMLDMLGGGGSARETEVFTSVLLAKRKGDVGGESVSWVKMLGIHHQGKEEGWRKRGKRCPVE